MSKKYEEGFEPLTSEQIRTMLSEMPDIKKQFLSQQIDDAIERMVATNRVNILVDENGDFIYELTEKGIAMAKKQIKSLGQMQDE